MRFTAKEVVRGASRFSGAIDGQDMKSGYIYVDVSLDQADKGNGSTGFGFRTEAMKVEDLGVIDKIKATPFPFTAELTIEQKATRKATQLVVVDCKPLAKA